MVSSMEELSSDLNQLSATKKNHLHLRKAFNLLKSHASTVANFTLQWHDLMDHFVFINNSIQTKLDELHQVSCSKDTQLFESQVISPANHLIPILKSKPKFPENDLTPDNGTDLTPTIESLAKAEEPHLPGEAEINDFSIEEGKALLVYLLENWKQRESVRLKIVNSLKASTKPGKLVIEAVRWFYYSKEVNDGSMDYGSVFIRRSCVFLLEEMMKMRMSIEPQEKEEAKELLLVWMEKTKVGVEHSLEAFALLLLAGAFGLKDCFDGDKVLNLFYDIVQRKKAIELFRSLGLEDRALEFIEKLISRQKRIVALRFIYAFGLVGKFSPVTILKDYLMEAKTSFKVGADSQQAKKERFALREVIRCIEKYKLGSKYSPDALKNQLQKLSNQDKNIETKANAIIPGRNKRAAPDAESKLNKRKKRRANLTNVVSMSMEGDPSSLVNQASADLLMQPPQDTPDFPSPRNSMLPSTSQYFLSSMQSSYPQSSSFSDHGVHFSTGSSERYGVLHSTSDTKQRASPVGSFNLATSTNATQNTITNTSLKPAVGQNQSVNSDYTTPSMGSTLKMYQYGLNIGATTGLFASSIAPLHSASALKVNTGSHTSGYGGMSQHPPSIYHH